MMTDLSFSFTVTVLEAVKSRYPLKIKNVIFPLCDFDSLKYYIRKRGQYFKRHEKPNLIFTTVFLPIMVTG
jgi:hypothetical protein